jgi:hypothetical protein
MQIILFWQVEVLVNQCLNLSMARTVTPTIRPVHHQGPQQHVLGGNYGYSAHSAVKALDPRV